MTPRCQSTTLTRTSAVICLYTATTLPFPLAFGKHDTSALPEASVTKVLGWQFRVLGTRTRRVLLARWLLDPESDTVILTGVLGLARLRALLVDFVRVRV